MRRLIPALLPLALLATSCSTTDYDLVSTASLPRFEDKDPQDFGARSPHRHQVHGIDVS
jgi:lysozyme